MKNYLILFISITILAFEVGCESKSATQPLVPAEVIPVKVVPIKPDSSQRQIVVSGQVTTDDEVKLSFKITGIIKSILVEEGDAVKKGQLLATLDQTEISSQVLQAKLAYEKAERDYIRTKNLYADSVATLEQLQNINTALEIAQQQLNAATFNKSHAEIRAPKDGFVINKFANPGQLVSSGTAVLQTNGANASNWILKVGVSDKDWASINVNDHAEIEIAALAGEKLKGEVIRKAQSIDPMSGAFAVEVKLVETTTKLASGMFGKAVITPTEKKTASAPSWSIPYDALLDANGNTGFVFITNDGKEARKVQVTIAGIEKNHVTIKQGLENATSLIVSGSAYLSDHSPINIIK